MKLSEGILVTIDGYCHFLTKEEAYADFKQSDYIICKHELIFETDQSVTICALGDKIIENA